MDIKKLGLIAGKGKLPVLVANAAKEKAIEIISIASFLIRSLLRVVTEKNSERFCDDTASFA